MKQTLKAYTTGPWQMQGNTLVAPVILVREGVHHGSHGPIYWAPHILEANAHKWENVPVSIDHPADAEGRFVSITEAPGQAVGRVRYARYDSQKKAIRGEIHVSANHPRRAEIQRIKEVSMGVFSDERYESGEWNGKQYIACSIAMEPDHLAILPDQQGACSWEDGCGIRVNQALQAACANYVKHEIFNNGGNTMEEEKLLPADVQEEESKENPQEIEAYADANNLLLPPEFNRGTEPKQSADEEDVLLPAGLN